MYVSNNNISTLYIAFLYHIIFAPSTVHYYKVRTFIEPGPRANNFVRPPPASAASIYLRDARGGAGGTAKRFIRTVERSLSFRIRPSRRCTLIVPGTNNELPAPLSSRRRKTLRNETARWEYEIVACVSTRVSPHVRTHAKYVCTYARANTHSAVGFLAVARYLIFASSPLCRRGKSS